MNKLRLLFNSIKKRGLLDTLSYIFAEYYFDLHYGVDTREIVELDALPVVGNNKAHGVPYQATNYLALKRAFSQLNSLGRQFDKNGLFVDFGCGKGRAMMVAMEHGYSDLVGVEFAAPLLEVCEKNLNRFAANRAGEAHWELVHADAASYEIPPQATTFFFYNPFGCSVMEEVLRNIGTSLRTHTRDVIMVYVNPVCRESFLAHGYRELVHIPHEVSLFTYPNQ